MGHLERHGNSCTMFELSEAFNQDLSSWNVSIVSR